MADTVFKRGNYDISRPLHFIWVLDCSGGMGEGRIQALNTAIREALPRMREVASAYPWVRLLMGAVKFSNGAQWHLKAATPIDQVTWTDLEAGGVQDLGRALELVAAELSFDKMPLRMLPPVLVLVSDGGPTDDFGRGLKVLLDQPWGRRAVRLAIALGEDGATPEGQAVLQRFIGHPEIKPLQANGPNDLVRHIKWVSTVVVDNLSKPPTRATGDPAPAPGALDVPLPPAPTMDSEELGIW